MTNSPKTPINTPPRPIRHRNQRGLTLAETLLVLAIGTVAIVGGTILYLQASGAQKINQMVNNLNALQGQVAGLYATSSSYGSGEMTDILINSGIVPPNMVVRTGGSITMRNAWGAPVTVNATGNGNGYRVSMEAVPKDACISLLTKLATTETGSLLRGFTVTSGAPASGSNPTVTPPVSLTDAIGACASNDNNGISFYYR